jgi:hypothetical protein
MCVRLIEHPRLTHQLPQFFRPEKGQGTFGRIPFIENEELVWILKGREYMAPKGTCVLPGLVISVKDLLPCVKILNREMTSR